jgi:multidrug efflux system outer membrane protein
MGNIFSLSNIAFAIFTLSGCAVGPDYTAPQVVEQIQLEQPYQQAANATRWWRAFDDVELNRLVSIALEQNRTLQKAQANVERAAAIFKDADNDWLPKGSLDVGYQASENSTISLGDNNVVSRGNVVGTRLSWDLDLFGKIRRATEAAAANAQQADVLWQEAQVQIISQVASSYGDFRSAQLRLQVAEHNLENLQQTRKIVEVRRDAGFASEFEIARVDAQYYEIKTMVPAFSADLLRAKATLSALLGFAPGELTLADALPLPQLSQPIAIVDSRDYLKYRADVAAAERRLAASTANIGVATADLYPALSIKGFLGFVSAPGLALNAANQAWSVAPTLSWQAADLGSVKAQIRAANASARMALADFEQEVLDAVNEIQLSLHEYNLSREQQIFSELQYKASTKAMLIARVRYEAGSGEFFDLLDAERTWLNSRDQLAQIEHLSFEKLVSVYRVFGGSLAIQRRII